MATKDGTSDSDRYIHALRVSCNMQKTLLVGTRNYPDTPLVWEGELDVIGKKLGVFQGYSLSSGTVGRIMKSKSLEVYLRLLTVGPDGQDQPPCDIYINKSQWAHDDGFWNVTLIVDFDESRSWRPVQQSLFITPCTPSGDALDALINRRV